MMRTIGAALKAIRDLELYKELGYAGVDQFMESLAEHVCVCKASLYAYMKRARDEAEWNGPLSMRKMALCCELLPRGEGCCLTR